MSTPHQDSRFVSFTTLRYAHTELLRSTRHVDMTTLHAQMRAFVESGVRTGVILDNEDERRSTQTMLDYWAALLYRNGIEPPDATLLEFNSALAPVLSDADRPYVGLDAFNEHTADRFFGRDRLIKECLLKLTEYQVVAIIGDSGSGKSSLVLGGIIPALQSGKNRGQRTLALSAADCAWL